MAVVHFTAVLQTALKVLLLLQTQHHPSYHLVRSAFIYWGGINIRHGWELVLSEYSKNIKYNIFPAGIKSGAPS